MASQPLDPYRPMGCLDEQVLLTGLACGIGPDITGGNCGNDTWPIAVTGGQWVSSAGDGTLACAQIAATFRGGSRVGCQGLRVGCKGGGCDGIVGRQAWKSCAPGGDA